MKYTIKTSIKYEYFLLQWKVLQVLDKLVVYMEDTHFKIGYIMIKHASVNKISRVATELHRQLYNPLIASVALI